MTSIHDLKLGSNTLEVLEVILGSLEAFPDEIAKLDLSKFTKIAGDIDKSYQNIQSLGANVTSMKEAISQTKLSIDEIKRDFDSKISTFAVDLDSVNDIKSIIVQAQNQISAIKSSVDNSLREFNSKNAVFTAQANKTSADIESFNAFARSVNDALETIKDEVNTSKDEFNSKATAENIRLDTLKREVTALKDLTLSSKNDIDTTLIQANAVSQALTNGANRAYEMIESLANGELADETYLIKVVHSNAKLASQSLGLSLADNVTMIYRYRYERDLPRLKELQEQYKTSNELAKDSLDKLQKLMSEADKMVRNSQFYNYLGVMI